MPSRHPLPINTLDTPLHSTLSLIIHTNSTFTLPKRQLRDRPTPLSRTNPPVDFMTTDIQNLKSFDPFAEADDAGGEVKSTQQNYIHIRIQRMYTLYCTCVPCAGLAAQTPARNFTHGLTANKSRKADVNPLQSAMVARL